MNYLIVDDEPIAHRIIERYCDDLPHLSKVGNAYNAIEASTLISQQKVDLIFLDINMPKLTGFEWLKTLHSPPQIIVTTAHKEFALEGYELDIVDYLHKPFSLPRFLKAVNKASSLKKAEQQPAVVKNTSNSKSFSFFLKGDKKHHQVKASDILYVEAFGNYCKVYLIDKMILTLEKISSMEELLPNENFLRVHKSFVVSIDRIESIIGNEIHIMDHKIPIGQTYRSRVNQLMAGR